MHSHKTITIVTSPSLSSKPLPGCISPTTKGPAVQYRIEEHRRTVYVSSDVPPSEWDAHSLNQIFSIAELSEDSRRDSTAKTSPASQGSSRNSNYRSRHDPTKPDSPPSRKSSPSTPQSRPRILFYHKKDPYYGFTNFSEHPVIYKGKKYPTSEHLFQSFKVGGPPGTVYHQTINITYSFRNIAQT